MTPLYAEVVLPLPVDQRFTYAVPEGLEEDLQVGCPVLVPFRQSFATGYVVALKAEPGTKEAREIADLLDPNPAFSEEMLRLTRWVADYYLCSWGEVLKAALPAGIYPGAKSTVHLKALPPEKVLRELERSTPHQAQLLHKLHKKKQTDLKELAKEMGETGLHWALRQLERKGYVEVDRGVGEPRVRVKYERVVRLQEPTPRVEEIVGKIYRRAPAQTRCLRVLLELGGVAPTGELTNRGINPGTIRRLRELGLVEVFHQEALRDPYAGVPVAFDFPPNLTPEQNRALKAATDALQRGEYRTLLLWGVTGSGKTEVYLQAIARTLELGRGAIVLVPEIALTPQTVSRFRARFGQKVAVLHSRLSPGERYDSWRGIKRGEYRVVIGARSAVFAPVKNLGLIVVDEEHEATYKQYDTVPRYHARDVAIMRAKMGKAVALLGTATPSLESYQNTRRGKSLLRVLPHRIKDYPLPQVWVVDMRQEHQAGNWGIFSRLLQEKIGEKLNRGEQVILLQNRRGFSPFVLCRDCGFTPQCPNCNVTLTYHATPPSLRCHYCNHRELPPDLCPSCRGHNLSSRGTGTQRVERELHRLFPQLGMLRLDLDTTARKGAHRNILEAFQRGEAQVLLGTQMVAKGLHFPRVTLVGIVSADVGLHLPDFRAGERTFQLLTQVAGRAGRGELGGEVVIQTYCPEAYPIQCAREYDFSAFFEQEALKRQELHYPPFGRLLNVLLRGREETEVERAAKEFAEALRGNWTGDGFLQVLGPAPAPLPRLRGEYRWQILLKGERASQLQGLVRSCLGEFRGIKGVKLSLDMDPVEVL